MRSFRIIPIAALLLIAAQAVVHGQGAGPSRLPSPPANDRKKELSEAAEKLRQAKENVDLEKAKQAAQGAMQKLPPKVTDAAKGALQSPETRDKLIDAAKSAAETLMPDAQKLLKKEQATGAGTPAATTADAPVPPPAPQGPKPMPLQPIAEGQPISKKSTVTIESDDAVFDLKAAIFIYTGHVRARHPQFYIECEELEVHMVKDEEAGPKKPAPPKDNILAKPAEKPQDSRIKMAIARGPMVTIEKLTENGDIQQGKCKKAVYRSATGEIVMSDYPQVQRGNMLHIADQPDTEMIFDPNGKLHTSGHTRTVILQGDEAAPPASRGGLVPAVPATGSGNPNAQ